MGDRTAIEHLGFAATDRVVIVHADDVGMCEASVAAFRDLAAAFPISASVMVPCPWFPQVAVFCRERPELDVGVHLTLTSEWQGYRWGPLSTRDPASGLIDGDGYFHRGRQALHERGAPAAVWREMTAQLERAEAAGIRVTHLDNHMFSLFHTELLGLYLRLGTERRLPPIVPCRGGLPIPWFQPQGVAAGRRIVREWRRRGGLASDHLVFPDLSEGDALDAARRAFDALAPGLTHLILHPARDSPELRAITPDWASRAAEHETFMDERLWRHVEASDVHLIRYRDVGEVMFGRRPDPAGGGAAPPGEPRSAA